MYISTVFCIFLTQTPRFRGHIRMLDAPVTLLRLLHSHIPPDCRTTRELGHVANVLQGLVQGPASHYVQPRVLDVLNLSSFISASERHHLSIN